MWSLRQPALPLSVWAPPDRPPDYDLASARVSPFPCRLGGPDEPPCSAAAGYLYAFPCIHTAGRRNRGLGYGFSYAVTGPLGCRTSWGTWCLISWIKNIPETILPNYKECHIVFNHKPIRRMMEFFGLPSFSPPCFLIYCQINLD